MRKSTVYALVVLTLLSLGLVSVPRGFGQTQDIKIVSHSYYYDDLGELIVVGEVQNTGPNYISSVTLIGSVYSNGVDECDSSTAVWALDLPPQQEAPFYMTFAQASSALNGGWSGIPISSIIIQPYKATPTLSYQYQDLKIVSTSGSVDSTALARGTYWAAGTIENTGSQTAQNVTVIGTFFNSTGSVVAVGYTDLTAYPALASIGPSEKVTFTVGAWDINQTDVPTSLKITRFVLLAQTQAPILQGTGPIITPPPSTPSPTSANSPSPGTTSSSSPRSTASSSSSSSPNTVNSNSGLSHVVIYVVVAVLVLVAVAGTMLMLRKSKPHQMVKQTKKQTVKQTKKQT